MERTRAQTGFSGELLVQQELLDLGIDSARMTTDYGIDLVAYDRETKRAFSIQVKTTSFNLELAERRPDWKVRIEKLREADLFAFVLLDKREAWYVSRVQLEQNCLAGKRLVRSYNGEYAFTFYRTGAELRKLPNDRLIESDLCGCKGTEGLKGFLSALKNECKIETAVSVNRAS